MDIVVEIVAVTAMVYAGSAVIGRAMRTQTWAQIETLPGVGAIALGLKAVRREAVS